MSRTLQVPDDFAIGHQLRGVPGLGQAGSVGQRLHLLAAIYRFSPQVRLHPDDRYRPTAVWWYLERVLMRRHRAGWFDVRILYVGEVNVQSLISQSSGGQHSGRGVHRTNFFLEIRLDTAQTRRGSLRLAECYVHFRAAPGESGSWDIQYWFFYAYNGDITTGFDFEHEGDFEHVTVRIDARFRSVQRVFYHVHNDESTWREVGQFQTTESGGPIVYSAANTHATYWRPGRQVRDGLPDDQTADGGPTWQTSNILRLIGTRDAPRRGQEWIRYTGHWGQIGSLVSWLSGPYGPAFQRYWDNDS